MSMRTIVAGLSVAGAVLGASTNSELQSIRALAHDEHGNHAFAAGEPGDPGKAFRIVEVRMTDGPGEMAYAPNRLQVKKGEQIKFLVKNVGMVDHEFLIDSFVNNAEHKKEMEKSPEMCASAPVIDPFTRRSALAHTAIPSCPVCD